MKLIPFSNLKIEISSDTQDDEYQAEARQSGNETFSVIALSTTEDDGVVIHVGKKSEGVWMRIEDYIGGIQGLRHRIQNRKRDFLS